MNELTSRQAHRPNEAASRGPAPSIDWGGNMDPLELVRWVFHLIRSRPVLFFGSIVICTLGGVVLPRLLPPSFTATATLIVEPATPRLSGVAEDGAIGSWSDYLKSQLLVLKSRSVTRRAYELIADTLDEPEPAIDPIARFQERVLARSVNASRLICVSVSSNDPEDAARRANAMVDAYVAHCLETRRASSQQAFSWLTNQISSFKKKVERSDRDLLEHGRQGRQFSIETQQLLLSNRIATLDKHLTEATVRRIQIEATLEELESLQGGSLLAHAVPAEVLTPTASKLASELAGYEQQLEEHLLELKPQHPKVVKLSGTIEIRKAHLEEEMAEIVDGLQAQLRIICANQDKILGDLEQLKAESIRLAELAIRHSVLEREAMSNREMYELLLSRLAQSDIGGQVTVANISIVDRAHPPTIQDNGPSLRKVLAAMVVGCFLGLGLCFAADHLSRSSSEHQQASSSTGRQTTPPAPSADRRADEPTLRPDLAPGHSPATATQTGSR